jgi:glycosyltransferase involved in cell wall biosynthesis
MRLSGKFLRDFTGMYEHVPPLPKERLPIHYGQAQGLIVNSLAEGFAMVIPEALSLGTPVLTSTHSGAEGVVTDEGEGRLFPYGDDEALLTVLDWALSHPAELAEMGHRARVTAARWTWPAYRRVFVEWLDRVQHQGG